MAAGYFASAGGSVKMAEGTVCPQAAAELARTSTAKVNARIERNLSAFMLLPNGQLHFKTHLKCDKAALT
jgi:hypothetical protein